MYRYGLMTANETLWFQMSVKYTETFDNRYLEYLALNENHSFICDYLSGMIYYKASSLKIRANEILRIIAKHAKNDEMLPCIFANLASVTFTSQ